MSPVNHAWQFRVKCTSSSCISSSSSMQISDRSGYRSIQTPHSHSVLLDGGDGSSLDSHFSQHVGKWSLLFPHGVTSYQRYSGRLDDKVCHCCFNPLVTQGHVAQTRVLFLSLSGGGRETCIFNKGLPAMLERRGRAVYFRDCTNQCHFCISQLTQLGTFQSPIGKHQVLLNFVQIQNYVLKMCFAPPGSIA